MPIAQCTSAPGTELPTQATVALATVNRSAFKGHSECLQGPLAVNPSAFKGHSLLPSHVRIQMSLSDAMLRLDCTFDYQAHPTAALPGTSDYQAHPRISNWERDVCKSIPACLHMRIVISSPCSGKTEMVLS